MRNKTSVRSTFEIVNFCAADVSGWLLKALFLLLGLFTLTSSVCLAQDDSPYLYMPAPPSYSAPSPIENGYVEQANGHLHLEFPLGEALPQRGGKTTQYRLIYDSNAWGPAFLPDFSSNGHILPSTQGGWSTLPVVPKVIGGSNVHTSFQDADGNTHNFPTTLGGGNAYSTDSSGFYMIGNATFPNGGGTLQGVQVYAPDGSLVYSGTQTVNGWGSSFTYSPVVMDPNGNYQVYCPSQVQAGNYLWDSNCDTLGRVSYQSQSGAAGPPGTTLPDDAIYTYSVPNARGGFAQYQVTFVQITVNSNYQVSGWLDCQSCSMGVVKSILLPDGSSYSFLYDCDPNSSTHPEVCYSPDGQYYGEVTKMTLPSGGTISYQYQLFHDVYGAPSRWVSRRDSAATGTTLYAPSVVNQCSAGQVGCQQTLTVTNAAGVATTTTFTIDNGSWPVQVQAVDTTTTPGTVLSTTTTQYDMTNACLESPCVGHDYIRKTKEIVALGSPDGYLKTETKYQYDTKEDGLVTVVSEWGYALSPNDPDAGYYPKRQTFTQYYSPARSPYSSASPLLGGTNIHRPSQITVCSGTGTDADCPGGGTKMSQTKYFYDESAPTLISGIVNHLDANYGTGLVVRGNPTTVEKWIQGSQYAITHYVYDTTGQILSATDPNGNPTTYGYADNFRTDINATSSSSYTPTAPTNAYPTTITSPAVNGTHLVTTNAYYFGDGKLASVTDANNVQSSYHYDGSGRTLAVETPNGWGEFIYTSPTQIDSYTSVADTTVSTACTSCQHHQVIFDTFGRPTSSLLVNAPGGATGVDTAYDSLGHVSSVSHPYGPLNVTKVYETYTYDIENRIAKVTHPDGNYIQTLYGSNAGSTPQAGPLSNGPGFHKRTVDEAGKGLDYWYDAFGQLLEVDEPYVSSGFTYTSDVGVSGDPSSVDVDPCAPYEDQGMMPCPETIVESGGLTLTINGHSFSSSYGADITPQSIYSQLASSINSSNIGVHASVDPTVGLVLTSATNFSVSTSSYSYDTTDFPSPSVQLVYSGPTGTSNGGGSPGSTVGTFYTYDALNRLVQTAQDSQIRTFSYDGRGNLVDTTNPEISDGSSPAQKCHVTYSYDNNGNLYSRTRPAANQTSCTATITTTYGPYDAWNRSLGRSYSDGEPGVAYTYDQGGATAHALGMLTTMSDASGSETYQYDTAERINQVQKTIGSTSYTTSYVFNLAGLPTQITYPSGRVVTPFYDNVGRLIQVSSNGTNYLTIAPTTGFDASGHVLQQTYGNNVVGHFTYSSDRSQLSSISYTNSGSTLLSLNYGYKLGDCSSYTTGMTTSDNGMIQCIQDVTGTQQAGRSAAYTYDALGRVQTAITTGSSTYPQWGLSWEYDRFGNRLTQAITAGSGYAPLTPVDALTNRLSTGSYDAVGNLLNSGIAPNYNGENQLVYYSGGTTYTYDGNGLRSAKSSGSGTTTVYVSPNGQTLDEYDNGAAVNSPTREYIYAGSTRIATITAGALRYFHQDLLSTRVTTDSTGNVIGEQGHYPFGELWYQTGTTNNFIFTGKERDTESQLDYFSARYYGSLTGRFMSPDPSGIAYAAPTDPQSLNLYAYTRGNPLINIDPTGLECVWSDGSYDSYDDPQTGNGAIDSNGNHTGCIGQGGVWVDHSYFAANGLADWQPAGTDALGTEDLKYIYDALSGNTITINVYADGSQSATMQGMSLDGTVLTPVTSSSSSAAPIQGQDLPNCYEIAFATIADDLNPFTPGYSTVTGATGEAAAYASAVKAARAGAYAASRTNTYGYMGLIKPLSSRTYRGMVAESKFLGKASGVLFWGTIDAALIHAIYNEVNTPCKI